VFDPASKRSRNEDEQRAPYWEAVTAADRKVDALIAAIRRREDAGALTAAGAAAERIEALEAHLAEIRRLRQEHLGGD
jgi:hypothetical protein